MMFAAEHLTIEARKCNLANSLLEWVQSHVVNDSNFPFLSALEVHFVECSLYKYFWSSILVNHRYQYIGIY